jgi:hypothetical protein
MWVPEGKRPIVIITTGSHQKTCVFGALSIDRWKTVIQTIYNTFDRFTFLDYYLKKLQNKFHKIIYIILR